LRRSGRGRFADSEFRPQRRSFRGFGRDMRPSNYCMSEHLASDGRMTVLGA
jgi:hypothetical protein